MKKGIIRSMLCLIGLVGLFACGGGGGGSSNSPDTAAPSAPTELAAAAISSSSIALTWTASTDNVGVTGYKIFRNGTLIGTATANAFNDTGLASSTTYTYTVAAGDAAENTSTQSTPAAATTLAAGISDTTAPSVPTGLITTATSTSQISLTWTAATDNVGVAGYKVYRAGTYLKTVTGTASSDTGLTTSTQYCYQISAYDAAQNESAKGTQVCATTLSAGSGTTTAGANFRMPDTNQTQSYTTTFGEDHDYTINPPSYTDNGNGTITDNVTGLVWQKQDVATALTWTDAGTYCDILSLGGQTDWRLPSQIELISLIDNGTYNPAINSTYFPNTQPIIYWSNTAFAAGQTSLAWCVDFSYGTSAYNGKQSARYVRCVRGGQ